MDKAKMMDGKDMNEKATPSAGANAYVTEECTRKRSYQLLGGPVDDGDYLSNDENTRKRSYQSLGGTDDDREYDAFQEFERSLSEDEAKNGSYREKAPRVNTFDQTYTLMQCLQSPGGPGWQRQGESSLASLANPYSLPASPFSPIANERDQVHLDAAPTLPSGQESQTWTGLSSRPQADMDPQSSWNYAQVYVVYPQGVAMLPESAVQQHAAAAAAANAYSYYSNVNGCYAAPHTPYPYRYSEQYPGNGVPVQAMPVSNTENHTGPQQQYSTNSLDYQLDTTQAPTNDSSPFAIDPLPEEQLERHGHPPVLLYTHNDDVVLSDYQIFLRKQIEFFEADKADVHTATPGRKKPVALGQVGIRCKHCANVPIPHRTAASVYFPSKLKGLYQAAQNIGTTHLKNSCPNLPDPLRAIAEAFQVDGKRATAGHGGKLYWSDAARTMGIIEAEDGLRFFTPTGDNGAIK